MKTTISGKVIRGKSRGSRLGFPTVNINLDKKIESGVYAGSVKIGNKTYRAGIFVNQEGALLEAHIIGFSRDLYGEEIEVNIGKKIRNVLKFKDEEKLKKQIEKDIKTISNS
jgi:riboflavin kinase/FMN adenylyltransferase